MIIEKEYNEWMALKDVQEEIKFLKEDEIQDCFNKNLEFGTGGIRAIMGPGPNRLNIYTIQRIAKGYAQYIESQGITAKNRGVVIAYDNRKNSKDFAIVCANVLAFYDIKVYIFESLRPTPELSFTIRYMQVFGGIVITASHNPPQYNGCKIYDCHGCQCVPRDTDIIIKYINEVKNFLTMDLSTINKNLITTIDKEIDEIYYKHLLQVQENPELDKNNFKIVYTPLCGTGNIPIKTMLKRIGYDFSIVKEQTNPDPFFSTTKSPNPENIKSFELAIKLAEKNHADLIIATDPDCDRIGIMVKHNSKYVRLTGNQTGAILLYYLLSEKKKKNTLPSNAIVFNTIVTSDLGSQICSKYGVEVESTLTGFKYIGDKIREYKGKKTFLFGYEESFGYLIKDFCRDKDGVQSSIIIAEVCNFYKKSGKTLVDILEEIYQEFGFVEDSQTNETYNGIGGQKRIKQIINHLRNSTPQYIENRKVISKEDYLLSLRFLENGKVENISLPKSNVIKLYLEDGSWIVVRPSGNEPKIKYYKDMKGGII